MRQAEDPKMQRLAAEARDDRELQARWKADAPRQQRRLESKGWRFIARSPIGLGSWMHYEKGIRLLHSVRRMDDGKLWSHLSLSRADHVLPVWEQLRDVHWLLYPSLYGVQVCAPPSEHYTFYEVAHMWTCLDAYPLPDFTIGGAI